LPGNDKGNLVFFFLEVDVMYDFLISFINKLISGLSLALSSIVSLLPDSPFKDINVSLDSNLLGYLNWMFPIDDMLSVLTLWVSSILIYYVYSIVLRWVKAIQ
jgi:hypothetical protein